MALEQDSASRHGLPLRFRVIPSTRGEDGDPIDVLADTATPPSGILKTDARNELKRSGTTTSAVRTHRRLNHVL